MKRDEHAECPSSTCSDCDSFLAKVAHVPHDHAARAAHRSRTALSFENHARFELLRYLGAGSFGVVYEAFDRQRDAKVAIKVLASSEPERLLLFKQEFRAAARVVHPNVVAVFELSSARGRWFFSMELIEGRPLLEYAHEPGERTRVEARAQSQDALAHTLTLFLQFSRALSALHRARLLHRDLKPANVLVDRHGRVVVVDFGLAKVLGRAERSGRDSGALLRGMVVGTPGYLAPEVVRGEPESRASDWFSFGVMFYQALTGLRPFVPKEGARAPLPAASFCTPRALGIELPPEIERLCLALLADEASERPAAETVIATLTRTLGERATEAALRIAGSGGRRASKTTAARV